MMVLLMNCGTVAESGPGAAVCLRSLPGSCPFQGSSFLGGGSALLRYWFCLDFYIPSFPALSMPLFQWSLAASSPLSLSVLYLGSVQNKYIMWLNSVDSGQVDRLQIRLLRVSLFQLCSNLLPDTGLTWVFLPASAHVSYLQNRVFTTCGFFKSFGKEFCRFFHLEKAGKTP